VFQFVLSTLMIVATVVVYQQVQYIRSKDIGLQRQNLVYLPAGPGVTGHFGPYQNELLGQPGIAGVSRSDYRPISVNTTTGDVAWNGKAPDQMISFQILKVDYDYAAVTGLSLLQGRDFSRKFTTDSARFIINEEAARLMGMQHPVGQRLKLWDAEGSIIGVVKNFHSRSVHSAQPPLVITLDPGECSLVMVRTQAGNTAEALAALEKLHRQYTPEAVFEYKFMDQEFERIYRDDVMKGKLANGSPSMPSSSPAGTVRVAASRRKNAPKSRYPQGAGRQRGAHCGLALQRVSRPVCLPSSSPRRWLVPDEPWLATLPTSSTSTGSVRLAGGAALWWPAHGKLPSSGRPWPTP
jgi:hypothetical protein